MGADATASQDWTIPISLAMQIKETGPHTVGLILVCHGVSHQIVVTPHCPLLSPFPLCPLALPILNLTILLSMP